MTFRLWRCFYFKIGMPLFMMFLGGIGDTMADAMRYGYSRICCRQGKKLIPYNLRLVHEYYTDNETNTNDNSDNIRDK